MRPHQGAERSREGEGEGGGKRGHTFGQEYKFVQHQFFEGWLQDQGWALPLKVLPDSRSQLLMAWIPQRVPILAHVRCPVGRRCCLGGLVFLWSALLLKVMATAEKQTMATLKKSKYQEPIKTKGQGSFAIK